MAIAKVKKNFKSLMDSVDLGNLRDTSAQKEVHYITLTDMESAAAFSKGTLKLFLMRGYTREEILKISKKVGGLKNSYAIVIRRYYQEIIANSMLVQGHEDVQPYKLYQPGASVFTGTPAEGLRGVYVGTKSTPSAIHFVTFSIPFGPTRAPGIQPGSALLNAVTQNIRKSVWTRWTDYVKPLIEQLELDEGNRKSPADPKFYKDEAAAMGRFTPFAHEEGSTIGVLWLKDFTEQAKAYDDDPEMQMTNVTQVYASIAQYIKNNFEIDWTETEFTDPRTGMVAKSRKVRGTISTGNFPGSEVTDTVNLKKWGEDKLAEILDMNRALWGAATAEGTKLPSDAPPGTEITSAADFDASPTFRDTSIEGAKYILTLPLTKKGKLDKRFKEVQNFLNAKKPKPGGPRSAKERGAKGNVIKKRAAKSLLLAAAVKSKRVSNKRRPKGEFNLGKIQALINRGLADTIKQNMGRPALINRTGRFAESAQVVSMKPSQAGVSANYTYQLNPYETFENTGQIEWPAGYNPKPLIAKSIRQLAGQYLQTKLTVRRV
jgi:hypothetical protein